MASRVICLNCGEQTKRTVLQQRLEALNPTWSAEAHGVAPDGDVFLTEEQVQRFHVAACTRCGGPLKPDVVFFGDTVPRDKVDFVHRRVQEADSLLVVGSSLQVPERGWWWWVGAPPWVLPRVPLTGSDLPAQVYSGYRFVLTARDHQLPIAILNIGPTRSDGLASLKLDSRCGELLPHILVR